MKLVLSSFVFISICCCHSRASRTLTSVPIALASVAGDLVCSNPVGEADPMKCLQTVPCVSADVKGIEILGQGVRGIAHFYQLQVLNVSGIEQNVTVDFENILLGYAVSDPPLKAGVNNKNIAVSKLSTVQKVLKIPPNSDVGTTYIMKCHSASSCYSEVNPTTTVDFGSGKPGFACQSLVSEIRVKITVKEDRGAIQAVLLNGGHRSNGISDHFLNSPATIQINGGRPF
jgi:hypothetical protein